MIKPNELRIGNLVQWHNGSIEAINARMILSISEISPDHLTPKGIPITEEWLLKFGFKLYIVYNSSFNHWCKNDILIWSNGEAIYFDFEGKNDLKSIIIKTVHQLQNLYFSLTGKELIIKE